MFDWLQARTLGQALLSLIREGKKDSEEFKQLEAYYGTKKLREIYQEEIKREKEEKRTRESKPV